jgi:hypothetical protein
MATLYFLGTADPVAQVGTVQITGFDAATTYKLTVGAGTLIEVISVVGDTDADTTAAALAAAWNASAHPYCTAVTASVVTDTITLTAQIAGCPFTVVSSVSAGAGTIGAYSVVTASAGPHHWDTDANWDTGAKPVNADHVRIIDNDVNICWGLDQNAVDLATLYHYQSATGRIGLDRTAFATSADGEEVDDSKPEYREDYFKIGAIRTAWGTPVAASNQPGSQRIKLDNVYAGVGSNYVYNTASQSADAGLPAWRGKFADADMTVYISADTKSWGIGVDPDGVTFVVGFVHVTGSDSTVGIVGNNVSCALFQQDGGTTTWMGGTAVTGITSLVMNGGILETLSDMRVLAAIMNGGLWYATHHYTTDNNAIPTLTLNGGTIDATRGQGIRTWGSTVANLNGGSMIADWSLVTLSTTDINTPTTAVAKTIAVT